MGGLVETLPVMDRPPPGRTTMTDDQVGCHRRPPPLTDVSIDKHVFIIGYGCWGLRHVMTLTGDQPKRPYYLATRWMEIDVLVLLDTVGGVTYHIL